MQRTWWPEAGTIIVTGPYWKTRVETFKFWDLMWLILEVWQYGEKYRALLCVSGRLTWRCWSFANSVWRPWVMARCTWWRRHATGSRRRRRCRPLSTTRRWCCSRLCSTFPAPVPSTTHARWPCISHRRSRNRLVGTVWVNCIPICVMSRAPSQYKDRLSQVWIFPCKR